MKRIAAICVGLAMVFLMAGCSFSLYRREAESRNVYKDYIAAETDVSAGYAEKVAASRSSSVVSVIANTLVRTNRGRASVTQIYSGIIINAEGYVLTTSHAALLEVSDGSRVYSGEIMSAYAVLPEIYGDKQHYRLILVDYDTEAGLALFRFYDSFHYYTDESREESKEGFQTVAEFTDRSVVPGERCVGIGNSLGNALNSDVASPGSVGEIAQTVMSGVISDAEADTDVLKAVSFGGKEYAYLLTTVPVNVDMYGGALFDDSGYLIGLPAMKIGYESSATGGSGYFKRVAAAYPVSLLTDYIDSVAEESKTPIPYTLASVSDGEAA